VHKDIITKSTIITVYSLTKNHHQQQAKIVD